MSAVDDQNRLAFAQLRRRSERRLRILDAVLWGSAAAVVTHIAYAYLVPGDPKTAAANFVAEWIAGRHIPALSLYKAQIAGFIRPFSDLAVFGMFAVARWLIGAKAASARYYRAYVSHFNDDVLTRIARPRSFDPLKGLPEAAGRQPALDWIEPANGSSREGIWLGLHAFAKAQSGDGKLRSPFDAGAFEGFRWTVVLGRSGMGKTRIAVEAARRLARRADLNESARGTALARFGAFLRLRLWFLARREDDPWDCGLLESAKIGSLEGLAAGLKAWWPRRPTLLLLNDPLPGWAEAAIDILARAVRETDRKTRYDHPVRLVVINQSVPAEMRAIAQRYDVGSLADGDIARTFAPPELLLGNDTKLDAHDVRIAATQRKFKSDVWRGTDAETNHLLSTVAGNPLLLELALAQMAEGQPLTEITRQGLATERAQRVLRALELAKIIPLTEPLALACATLADGAKADVLRKSYAHKAKISDLRRAFPAENPAYFEEWVPGIKPELIGDAFVRLVLSDEQDKPKIARELVAACWRANAARMVRTILRFAREAGEADELRTALADPAITPFSDFALAELLEIVTSLMDIACRTRGTDGSAEPDPLFVAFAAQAAARLPAAEAARLLERAAQLIAGSHEDPHDEPLSARRGAPVVTILLALLAGAGSGRSADERSALRDAFLDVCEAAMNHGVDVQAAIRFFEEARALTEGGAPELVLRRLQALQSIATIASDYAIEELDRIIPSLRGTYDEALYEGEILLFVTGIWTNNSSMRERIRACAERVDRLAARFADETLERRYRLELQRAMTWRFYSYACSETASLGEAVEEAAGNVEDAARPFAEWPLENRRRFEFERARAWRNVAYACSISTTLRSRAVDAATRVDAVVDQFAGMSIDQRCDLEIERALAWCCAAVARSGENENRSSAQEAARKADEIARAIEHRPWSERRYLESRRAVAWANVGYAHSRIKDPHQPSTQAALEVDRIAEKFANESLDDRYRVEIFRARAWRYVALEFSETEAMRAFTEGAARRVDASADLFVNWPLARRAAVEQERSLAWELVSGAQCTTTVLRHETVVSARKVDRIAALFDDQGIARPFEIDRARSRAWLNVAHAEFHLGKGGERADQAAETVSAIAARGSRTPQQQRTLRLIEASAWRYAGAAWMEDGNTERADVAGVRIEIARTWLMDQPELLVELKDLTDCAARYMPID